MGEKNPYPRALDAIMHSGHTGTEAPPPAPERIEHHEEPIPKHSAISKITAADWAEITAAMNRMELEEAGQPRGRGSV
jgi:hypothetical protein